MMDFKYDEDPVHVIKDNGFDKLKLISPENRKKSGDKIKNPNYVPLQFRLKDFFGEIGIIVVPEKMTMWYVNEK